MCIYWMLDQIRLEAHLKYITMTMGYKVAHLAVTYGLTKMRFKQGTGDPSAWLCAVKILSQGLLFDM